MSSKLQQMLTPLRNRYGTRAATAILLSSAVLALVPLPGMAFLPIALAELLRKAHLPRLTFAFIPLSAKK